VIKRTEIQKIVNDYDDLRIAVLGSHSALEIMDGAKDEGLDTVFTFGKPNFYRTCRHAGK